MDGWMDGCMAFNFDSSPVRASCDPVKAKRRRVSNGPASKKYQPTML